MAKEGFLITKKNRDRLGDLRRKTEKIAAFQPKKISVSYYQKEITKSVRLLGISITNLYSNNMLDQKNLSMQLKFNF